MLLFLVFASILANVFAITYVETYFNEKYVINYNVPGRYTLHPDAYKKAPTLFVIVYGAGGGAGMPLVSFQQQCTGQNGGYSAVLLDTKFGKRYFDIFVGKGGLGAKQNFSGCDYNSKPTFRGYVSSTDGEKSHITSTDGKLWVESEGGSHGITNSASCQGWDVVDKGYTNISFKYGVKILERFNGASSYYGNYFNHNISRMGPGYGGRGASPNMTHLCNEYYQIIVTGSGNDGLVTIIPVAVPLAMYSDSEDVTSVDLDYFMKGTATTSYPTIIVTPTPTQKRIDLGEIMYYLGISLAILILLVISAILLFMITRYLQHSRKESLVQD